MDTLRMFAIYIAASICIVLALFVSMVLYEFLVAACDVVSDWMRNLEREWWKKK